MLSSRKFEQWQVEYLYSTWNSNLNYSKYKYENYTFKKVFLYVPFL